MIFVGDQYTYNLKEMDCNHAAAIDSIIHINQYPFSERECYIVLSHTVINPTLSREPSNQGHLTAYYTRRSISVGILNL